MPATVIEIAIAIEGSEPHGAVSLTPKLATTWPTILTSAAKNLLFYLANVLIKAVLW